MTLLATVFAAILCTVLWYKKAPDNSLRLGTLCLMYWGASLMWLVDAVFEYSEQKAAFFQPSPEELLNDLFLGLSAVALSLVAWLVLLLVKDPKGVVKAALLKK